MGAGTNSDLVVRLCSAMKLCYLKIVLDLRTSIDLDILLKYLMRVAGSILGNLERGKNHNKC